MRVKRKNVATILNKIWESELDVWFGWKKDGDIRYSFDGEIVINTGQQNIQKGLEMMCKEIIVRYPSSEFANWYMKFFNYDPDK